MADVMALAGDPALTKGSQRADGTWRKDVKVRKGFAPEPVDGTSGEKKGKGKAGKGGRAISFVSEGKGDGKGQDAGGDKDDEEDDEESEDGDFAAGASNSDEEGSSDESEESSEEEEEHENDDPFKKTNDEVRTPPSDCRPACHVQLCFTNTSVTAHGDSGMTTRPCTCDARCRSENWLRAGGGRGLRSVLVNTLLERQQRGPIFR